MKTLTQAEYDWMQTINGDQCCGDCGTRLAGGTTRIYHPSEDVASAALIAQGYLVREICRNGGGCIHDYHTAQGKLAMYLK